MTNIEVAAHLDMTPRSLFNLLRQLGLPTKNLDLDQTRVAYIRHLRSRATGRTTPPTTATGARATTAGSTPSIATEKALLTRAQRELAEHHLAVATGKFIALDDMKKDAFEMFRRVRDRMQNIPLRLADGLASMVDPRAIEAALDGEIRAALVELSEGKE